MKKLESMMVAGRWLRERRNLLKTVFFTVLIVSTYLSTPFSLITTVGSVAASIVLTLLGLYVRWAAYSAVEQNIEVLSSRGGIYSKIRFPIYTSDLLIIAGLSLFAGVWSFILVITPVSYGVVSRMVLWEERELRGDDKERFDEWATRTMAIIPITRGKSGGEEGAYKSRSVIKKIKKIAPALLYTTAAYAILAHMKTSMTTLSLEFNPIATIPFVVALILYLLTSRVEA